jgi:hypothetical protein
MGISISKVGCPIKIPDCRPCGMRKGRTLFLLLRNFIFYINGIKHVIPKGFVFDGASIPYGFRNAFNPADTRYMAFALIHDYLYSAEIYPRLTNDRIFFVGMMLSNEVPEWKCRAMYSAVVVGGAWSYHIRKPDEVWNARKLLGITSTKRPFLRDKISPLGYMPGEHSYVTSEGNTTAETESIRKDGWSPDPLRL